MAKRKNTFIHKPVYPGGTKALEAFVKKHLRYPKAALEKRVEGTVRVEYSLNQQGKVIKAEATTGPADGCREEAVRVIKLLRFKVPKDYKMSVRYHQHLNINFNLPKPESSPKSQITYQITPGKATPPEPSSPAKSGGSEYDYTISW